MVPRPMGIWAFVLVGAVILAIVIYSEVGRRRALAPVAGALGLSFSPGQQALPPALDSAGFYLFTQGPPEILTLMQGRRGADEVALFGYGYDAPQGEEGSREIPVGGAGQIERWLQTALWVKGGRALPDFDLSPTRESVRRVAQRFGMMSVSIDGRSDFCDRYLLVGRDPAAVRGLFRPSLLEALVADPGWFVEGRGDQWLLYRIKERFAPGDMGAFLARGLALVDALQAGAGAP